MLDITQLRMYDDYILDENEEVLVKARTVARLLNLVVSTVNKDCRLAKEGKGNLANHADKIQSIGYANYKTWYLPLNIDEFYTTNVGTGWILMKDIQYGKKP